MVGTLIRLDKGTKLVRQLEHLVEVTDFKNFPFFQNPKSEVAGRNPTGTHFITIIFT